jgi:4-hydroxymandelate oxidase
MIARGVGRDVAPWRGAGWYSEPIMHRLLTIQDFEDAARGSLSQLAYDYYRSGADGQLTLARNRAGFDEYELWPRMLVDVAHIDLRTELFGLHLPTPILVAPTAYQRLAHPEGELAMARGVAAAGSLMVVSTLATTRLEEVAAASSAPKWFQLYIHRDRGFTRALVERAQAAGYRALVLTVDTPLLGRRLADERNGFALPPGLTMANLVDAQESTPLSGSALASYCAARHDASLTWKDVDWLRDLTTMPILFKGVLRGDDAARAVERGVAGLIVSNHGARQLDGAPATIDALPEVLAAVAGRCPVLLDGGVRWGTDVLKALGLGATAVLVGRPTLWGLAVAGAEGVTQVLELLRAELERAMALAGCPSLSSLPPGLVRRRRSL